MDLFLQAHVSFKSLSGILVFFPLQLKLLVFGCADFLIVLFQILHFDPQLQLYIRLSLLPLIALLIMLLFHQSYLTPNLVHLLPPSTFFLKQLSILFLQFLSCFNKVCLLFWQVSVHVLKVVLDRNCLLFQLIELFISRKEHFVCMVMLLVKIVYILVFRIEHVFKLSWFLLITVFFLNHHLQLHLELLFKVMPRTFLISFAAVGNSDGKLIKILSVMKCSVAWIE